MGPIIGEFCCLSLLPELAWKIVPTLGPLFAHPWSHGTCGKYKEINHLFAVKHVLNMCKPFQSLYKQQYVLTVFLINCIGCIRISRLQRRHK